MPLLPSLLDRLTDDTHILGGIQECQQKIKQLEKRLQTAELDSDQKQQLLRKLSKNQTHSIYLQEFIGSFEHIRDAVKRDLGWLLNSRSFYMETYVGHEVVMLPLDEEKYPYTATSVINYGLPDLTGKTAASVHKNRLEKTMRQILLSFEPRIMPESLTLNVVREDSMSDHNVLMFDIDAMLWAEPAPVHLQIRTQLDLETGDIDLVR
jgi:type VI secretion system lysozyme-like protein